MRLARNWIVLLISALIVFTGVPSAHAQEQSGDIQAEMRDLKAKVAELEAKNADEDAARAATIKDVLADAQSHGDAVTAGYANRRFFIQSEDGNFVLRPWVHIQIRYSSAFRDDGKGKGTSDDAQSGFELRRARFGFDGNVFSPDLCYFINWATNRENSTLTVTNSSGATVGTTTSPVGGLPVLEEAWLKYHFHDTPYSIKVGQMHDPLDHENIVGSKYRAPEASLQGDIFGNTDTFTQGATLIYDNHGALRVEAGVTDGIRAANTNFEDYPNNGINYDGGVAGRVEYKLMGNWKDYDQLTALNDKKDLLVLGSGYDYSYGGNFSSLTHTVDLQYGSPSGLFAYVSYLGRYTTHNPGIPTGGSVSTAFGKSAADHGEDTYEPSGLGEVAYLINNKWEPFARYEYMHLAGTPAGSENNVSEISLGANYYMYGQNVKLTVQGMYLPRGIPLSDDSNDVLISNGKPEFVLMTQLQLLF